MTLTKLPPFALFRFTKGIAHYPPECVWQKLVTSSLVSDKEITWHSITKVKRVGCGWKRDRFGMEAVSGRKEVTLVARRKSPLTYTRPP